MAAPFGQQVRRGVTGAAVVAAVMATVAAAQAPRAVVPAAAPSLTATGGTSYYTEAAPPLLPDKGAVRTPAAADKAAPPGTGYADIPATVLAAYKAAAAALAKSDPGCHLPWQLLAAIGKVESVHARNGRVDAHGTARPPILGPQLNGSGFAAITDTDHGAYDGDVRYDRAVGPMQFIPSTWSNWGTDGNGDGRADPNNVFDAALAAGRYLCAGGRDLSNPQSVDQAILSYNYSDQYLATVRSWFEYYEKGYRVVPDGSGPLPPAPDSGGSPATAPGLVPPAPGSRAGGGTPGSPRPGSPIVTVPAVPSPSQSAADDPTPTPTPSPTPVDPPTADPSPSDPPTTVDPTPSDPAPSDPPTSSEPPTDTPTPSPSGGDPESTATATPSADVASAS